MRVGRNPSLGIRLEMSLLKRMMETPVKARHALCTHVHGKHTNHMHTQNLANVYHLSVSVSPCVYLSLSVSLCLTHTLHIPFTDTWHTYALNIPTVHTLIHILIPHPHIILYVHTIHVLHIYCKPTITCTYTSSPHMNCSTHISHMYYTCTHTYTGTHKTYTSSHIYMHTTLHGKYMQYTHSMCTCTVNIQKSYIHGKHILHIHYIHMYSVVHTTQHQVDTYVATDLASETCLQYRTEAWFSPQATEILQVPTGKAGESSRIFYFQ